MGRGGIGFVERQGGHHLTLRDRYLAQAGVGDPLRGLVHGVVGEPALPACELDLGGEGRIEVRRVAPLEISRPLVQTTEAGPAAVPRQQGGQGQEAKGAVSEGSEHPAHDSSAAVRPETRTYWDAVELPERREVLWVGWHEEGIARVLLPGAVAEDLTPTATMPMAWRRLLKEYFARAAVDPARLPLGVRGSPFRGRVWRLLREIPRGQVRTYGEVAVALGMPGSARAVGRAAGANPVPLVVPCHRLIARGGALGGFSQGLAWKRRLLALEGVPIGAAGSARVGQLSLMFGDGGQMEGSPPIDPPPPDGVRSQ